MGTVERSVGTGGDISREIINARTKGIPALLKRAVVIDVFFDPDSLTDDDKRNLVNTYNVNADLIDVMPINSIIGQIVNDGSGHTTPVYCIMFPLFSSHFMLPVQPGETVFVSEETGGFTTTISYWFTRISAQKTVEDANYTHLDRRYDPTMNPGNFSTMEKTLAKSTVKGPGFPNGANTTETLTLAYTTPDKKEPYEEIIKNSKASPLTTPEPVPRWKKRPQEFVLQGTNNTLICLGEDRTGSPDNTTDAKGNAGTIDVVVGRGRKMPTSHTEEPEETAPRVIINSRGQLETDKAPYRHDFTKKDNPKEGNPDFKNDASRIYVSMQTEGDKNFNIKLNSKDSLALPNISGAGTNNRAHIIEKSDHIRLIARKDDGKQISGTILLVREGNPDENLGYFYIDDKGQIQIESNKIYLGTATTEQEPMVLFTKFRETEQQLQAQIDAVEKRFNELCDILNSAFASNIGNLGAPIPSLLSAAPIVTTTGKSLTADLTSPRGKADVASSYPSQSDKIFVEPK